MVGRDSRCIHGNSQAQILSGNTATDWVGLYFQQSTTYIVCKQLQIEYIATAGSSHSKLPTDPGCDMGWVWQSSRLCILQLPGPKRWDGGPFRLILAIKTQTNKYKVRGDMYKAKII